MTEVVKELDTIEETSIKFLEMSPKTHTIMQYYLCEPCLVTVKLSVPIMYYKKISFHRFTSYQLTGLKCEIWCNIHDKFSYILLFLFVRSSGRWHSIPMRKKCSELKVDENIFTFEVSLLPISSGRYEFTARARMTKIYDSDWKWLGKEGDNCTLMVLPSTLFNSGYTPSSGWVRQVFCWFEDAVTIHGESLEQQENEKQIPVPPTLVGGTNSFLNKISSTSTFGRGGGFGSGSKINNKEKDNISMYNSAVLAGIALESDVDPAYCKCLVTLLCESQWMKTSTNSKRLLLWLLGSSNVISEYTKCLSNFVRDLSIPKRFGSSIGVADNNNNNNNTIPITTTTTTTNTINNNKYDSNYIEGGLIALLKLATVNRVPESRSVFKSISIKKNTGRTREVSPKSIIRGTAVSQNDRCGILLELLLDVVKNCHPVISNLKFCHILIETLCSSSDNMIHMYLPRVLRSMYDKTSYIYYNNKEIINSQFVIQSLINAFSLHSEWYNITLPFYINNELPSDIEKHATFGGPLTALLKITANIIEHKPKELLAVNNNNNNNNKSLLLPIKKKRTIFENNSGNGSNNNNNTNTNSSVQILINNNNNNNNNESNDNKRFIIQKRHDENMLKLCNSLLSLVYTFNVEHPDFTKLLELLLLIAKLNTSLKPYISKKLLFHWPKTECAKCCLFIRFFYSLLENCTTEETNDSSDLINLIIKRLSLNIVTPNVDLARTTLRFFEYTSSSPIWNNINKNQNKYISSIKMVLLKLKDNQHHWNEEVRNLSLNALKDLKKFEHLLDPNISSNSNSDNEEEDSLTPLLKFPQSHSQSFHPVSPIDTQLYQKKFTSSNQEEEEEEEVDDDDC